MNAINFLRKVKELSRATVWGNGQGADPHLDVAGVSEAAVT